MRSLFGIIISGGGGDVVIITKLSLLCIFIEMEQAEFESYQTYQNNPDEAFTPLSFEEEEYLKNHTIAWELRSRPIITSIEQITFRVINDLTNTLHSSRKTKNKWRKKRDRGHAYKWNHDHLKYSPDEEKYCHFLREQIPPKFLRKETPSDFYIFCPFHKEKSASCAISKKLGIVKCFGCGKSYNIMTFFSMVHWNTRRYRYLKLQEAMGGVPGKHKTQIKIDFPGNSGQE